MDEDSETDSEFRNKEDLAGTNPGQSQTYQRQTSSSSSSSSCSARETKVQDCRSSRSSSPLSPRTSAVSPPPSPSPSTSSRRSSGSPTIKRRRKILGHTSSSSSCGDNSSSSEDEDELEEGRATTAAHEDERQGQEDSEDGGEEKLEDAHDDEVETAAGSKLDFDLMLERKREQNRRYRKRKDIAVINDNDDAIARLIADMRQAAREDRELNLQRLPATRKMSLLPVVMSKLTKVDLQLAFVEANVLSAMTEWLAPMPYDNSLPHVQIRANFLRYLRDLPIEDISRLKESGVGKAVMYLYRHPKETRPNKDLAGKIISKWSRPIFNLCTDFSSMTKEDRQRRDEDMARKLALHTRRKQLRSGHDGGGGPGELQPQSPIKATKAVGETCPALRPGDPGWVGRARVPMPDNKEFVVRPQWQSNEDISAVRPKQISLLEKHKRRFADKKKQGRLQHAVKISLEGKNMKL